MKKRLLAMLISVSMLICILPINSVSAAQKNSAIYVESHIKSYNSPVSSNEEFEEYIIDSVISQKSSIDVKRFNFVLEERVKGMSSEEINEYIHEAYPELDLKIYADNYIDLYNLQGWGYKIHPTSYRIETITLKYFFSKEEYDNRNNAYKAVAQFMVADLKASEITDLEKALILHDRLALHCEYDYESYKKYEENNSYQIPRDSFNMYGALVNGVAVCEGYSRAYQYMLGLLGIEGRLCVSDELKHMWNIVTIEGKEYHVDVTHDDPVYNMEGRVNHDNFLLSSAAMSKNNNNATDFDMSLSDKRYDSYFWQNSKTAFQYVNESIYYIDNNASDLILWNGANRDCVLDIHNRGTDKIKLSSYKNLLYYSFDEKIWGLDVTKPDSVAHAVYTPEIPSGYEMYGFNIVNGEFVIECHIDPNDGKPYIIKESTGSELDISASLQSALSKSVKSFGYDGTPKTLSINVSHDGLKLYENRDYMVVYKSNTNAGTATVTLIAQNGYKGKASAEFKISPKSIKGAKIASISDRMYTGKAIKPVPIVTFEGKKLEPNVDFKVSYSSNVATGKAKVTISGKGNYNGSVTKYFYIHPKKVTGLKITSASATQVKIKWSKTPSGTGYVVRRKTSKKGSFKIIGLVNSRKTTSYTDKTVKANKTYYYDVVAFKTVSGKRYGGVASAVLTAKTATKPPKISYYKNTSSKKAKIKWEKVSGASKYKLYMSTKKGSGYKCIYTGTKLNYTKSKLKKGKTYYFKVRTYRTLNGKKIYSSYSSVKKVKIKK